MTPHLLYSGLCLIQRGFLTVEGQISKYGGEEIHNEHAQDGDVADVLHSSLCWAEEENGGE